MGGYTTYCALCGVTPLPNDTYHYSSEDPAIQAEYEEGGEREILYFPRSWDDKHIEQVQLLSLVMVVPRNTAVQIGETIGNVKGEIMMMTWTGEVLASIQPAS
ncbi:hypothetical protein BCR33DRAFT_567357 [Rhizoclosmatium globosum]|uniref:Uncharacterized protein n=1 Tax=Rhizoclosmatium globosum TaxID=329046 RepID=A0A1Y2B6R3_9FUNG|nr:hypothetical protein BCR33DRAFT_567357 [Rhizoclosmatium globosum]|eukprot:ORY30522.1 hypothetical protein BCR33DRAFT_567357 [Rhizoclosmatium globosum]